MTVPRITILLPALALAATLLTACGPGTPDAEPTASVTPASTIPTTEPTTPAPDPVDVDADLRANIVDAISSGNTAALEGYLAPTVHLTYCASEAEGDTDDAGLVIDNLTDLTSSGASWDFDLPASTLDTYANDPGHYPAYADDFPEGAVVGLSSEKKVVSFVTADALITRIFICLDEYALTFED